MGIIIINFIYLCILFCFVFNIYNFKKFKKMQKIQEDERNKI